MAQQPIPQAPSADDTAWNLYMEMRENPSRASALNLARWLREDRSHQKAFDQVLHLWALAGAALVLDRRKNFHPSPDRLQ